MSQTHDMHASVAARQPMGGSSQPCVLMHLRRCPAQVSVEAFSPAELDYGLLEGKWLLQYTDALDVVRRHATLQLQPGRGCGGQCVSVCSPKHVQHCFAAEHGRAEGCQVHANSGTRIGFWGSHMQHAAPQPALWHRPLLV